MLAKGHGVANRMLAASFAPLNAAERRQRHGLLAKMPGDDAARG